MKRLTIVTAAVTALALASAPAFADNKGHDDHKQTGPAAIEIVGTVKSVVDTSTVTVYVAESSDSHISKALHKAMDHAIVTVKSDSATVVKRGGVAAAFTTIAVNDRVNLRATCVAGTPIICTASRIYAMAPVVKPLRLNLSVRGVVVSNAVGVLGVVVTNEPEVGSDNTFKGKTILGTTVTIHTDTATVVTKAGAAVTVASLTGFPAVSVQAICTPTTPAVCTAKRITVIVPTV